MTSVEEVPALKAGANEKQGARSALKRMQRVICLLMLCISSGAALAEPTPTNLEGMTWDVGFQFVAMRLCKIDYDPARIDAEIKWIASIQKVSPKAVRALAEKLSRQFEPNWAGKVSKNCSLARSQAKRVGLLKSSKVSTFEALLQ